MSDGRSYGVTRVDLRDACRHVDGVDVDAGSWPQHQQSDTFGPLRHQYIAVRSDRDSGEVVRHQNFLTVLE